MKYTSDISCNFIIFSSPAHAIPVPYLLNYLFLVLSILMNIFLVVSSESREFVFMYKCW